MQVSGENLGPGGQARKKEARAGARAISWGTFLRPCRVPDQLYALWR